MGIIHVLERGSIRPDNLSAGCVRRRGITLFRVKAINRLISLAGSGESDRTVISCINHRVGVGVLQPQSPGVIYAHGVRGKVGVGGYEKGSMTNNVVSALPVPQACLHW